jgi:hypothetical protein
LPGIAALRNMMGDVSDDHARKSSHAQKLSERKRSVIGVARFRRRIGLAPSQIGRRNRGTSRLSPLYPRLFPFYLDVVRREYAWKIY